MAGGYSLACRLHEGLTACSAPGVGTNRALELLTHEMPLELRHLNVTLMLSLVRSAHETDDGPPPVVCR